MMGEVMGREETTGEPATASTSYAPAWCPACAKNLPHRIETTYAPSGRALFRLCHCLQCKHAHTG